MKTNLFLSLFIVLIIVVSSVVTIFFYNPFTETRKSNEANDWCKAHGYGRVDLLDYHYCQATNCSTNQLGEEVCFTKYEPIP